MSFTKEEAILNTKAPQNALGAANMASGANSNQVGTPALIYRVPVADAASGNVDTLVVTHAIRIIDAWAVKAGAAAGGFANTVAVQTGAGVAVTSTMGGDVADGIVVRPTTIDDATHQFAAGATVRIARVRAGGNAQFIVYILAVRT